MLQCFVCLFMIYVSLVSEVRCNSSKVEWDFFTTDTLNLTLDFEDVATFASNLYSTCNNIEQTFEFEVDWEELVAVNNKYVSNTSKNGNKTTIFIIIACIAALLLAVLLFIYGKRTLYNYLHSGTYNVAEYSKAEKGFHELSEGPTLRKN